MSFAPSHHLALTALREEAAKRGLELDAPMDRPIEEQIAAAAAHRTGLPKERVLVLLDQTRLGMIQSS